MDTQEELKIIEDYTVNKIRITELAKKYHHNSRTITAILDKYNTSHNRGQLRIGQSNTACMRILTVEEKATVCNIYTNGGTVADCCKAVHCNQDRIRDCLKEFNLYKSHKDIMKELPQNQVIYPINEDFFFTQSANLAYLLGFLAADGYVHTNSNEIYLGLAVQDKEILEKLQALLGGRPLKEYATNKGMNMVKWGFTSQRVKNELATYGIVPQKTFILIPPDKILKQYRIDFIRGYFDGDGSINLIQGQNLRWQIGAANKEILEWIEDELEDLGIPKVTIYTRQPRTDTEHLFYYFQYSTNATKKIYNLLYHDDSLYLARKKQAFDSYLSIKK